MNIKILIITFILGISTLPATTAMVLQKTDTEDTETVNDLEFKNDDIEEFKKVFLQIGALLGLSLIIYLYVNFRFNRNKRIKKTFRKSNHEESISIEESIGYFRGMIDKTPDAIFVENMQGVVLEVNKAACQLHQSTREELIGKTIYDLTPKEIHDTVDQRLTIMNKKGELKFNSFSIGEDGKNIPVEISANAINFFGDLSILLIVRDISEQVAYEEKLTTALNRAEESERLKSSFLANMSHEVRTPMNSIMGFSELMCDTQLSDDQRKEFHQIIKTSSSELLNLLDDIIEFARIETQQIRLKTESTSPRQIIDQLKSTTQEIVAQKPSINLNIDLPEEETPELTFTTDVSRTIQIMRILLENAYKFTYAGSVKYGYKKRTDGKVCFFVEDTGVGITREKIPFVFEKFTQGDTTSKQEFGGTGIGLAICYHLTNFLGGYIWVESEEKQGSAFKVVLPTESTNELTNRSIIKLPILLLYHPTCTQFNKLEQQFKNSLQIINCETTTELNFFPMSNNIDTAIIETKDLRKNIVLKSIDQLLENNTTIILIISENEDVPFYKGYNDCITTIKEQDFNSSYIQSLINS